MKKTVCYVFAILLLVSAVPVFAGGDEEIVEEVAMSQFEGLTAVDRTQGWEVGKKGGQFIMTSFGSDPKSFNYIIAEETSTTDTVGQMYVTAFRRNQFNLEYEPAIAESLSMSDDQLTITVKLRSGLKWSDGKPLTAEDVVWTVNTIHADQTSGSRFYSNLIVADEVSVWKKIDDLTFSVTTTEVFADPYYLVSAPPYMPKHVFEPLIKDQGIEAVASFWGVDTDVTKVIGNGPFVISEYVPSQKIVMKPNPYYYEKDDKGVQLPYIDEFVYLLVEDQDTQLEKFLAGELDFLELRGEDFAVLVDRKQELNFELYEVGPGTTTNFVAINQNPKENDEDGGIVDPQLTWLSNKKFRKALAHLMDRETVINNLNYGFGYQIDGFVPLNSPFFDDTLADVGYQFDPEKAKALLDEINYIDRDNDGFREDEKGNKISLVLRTNSGNSVREGIIEIFAQEAQKVGLDMTAKPEDFNALVTRLVSTFDWELICIGLTGPVDPGLSNAVVPSFGNLHMVEPEQESPRRDWEAELDELWKMNQTTTDQAKRGEYLKQVQRIWSDNLPMIYVFSTLVMHAYTNEWGNLYPQSPNGLDWAGILPRMYIK